MPPAAPIEQPSHRLRTVIACMVVVVLLAELFTRLIAHDLPAPLQWDTYETQKKVQQIDALSSRGGADVVFLGSSLVDLGIDPQTFDRVVGNGVTSYNAGLESSIPRMTEVWTEDIVIPKLHPKVLVLGVGAYDFDANGGNRTAYLNAFLASSGAKATMGKDDPIQTANRWLGDVSSLWYHKDQLRDPETVVRAIFDRKQPTEIDAADLSSDGRQTETQNNSFVNVPRLNITNWKLGYKDVDAVKRLIAFAAQRKISVILVDMPVTNQFIDRMPHPQSDFRTFQNELSAVGAQSHSQVLSFDSIRSTSLFSDDLHLNRKGAEFFSTLLALRLKSVVQP
jgi:hypothetical protein